MYVNAECKSTLCGNHSRVKVRGVGRNLRGGVQFIVKQLMCGACAGQNSQLVYVIGWSTVVFGINSASNAVRKCEIVRGEAECYFTLPDCITSAINPKYHSMDHPITN